MADDRSFTSWLEDEVLEAFAAYNLASNFAAHISMTAIKKKDLSVVAIADVIAVPGDNHKHAKDYCRMRPVVRCHHVLSILRGLERNGRAREISKPGGFGVTFAEILYREVNILDAIAQASASDEKNVRT